MKRIRSHFLIGVSILPLASRTPRGVCLSAELLLQVSFIPTLPPQAVGLCGSPKREGG